MEVLPVDMNESFAETTIQDNAIRYGFTDIKGFGKSAAAWLVKHRPFDNFDDIISKAEMDENKIVLRNGTRRMAVNRGHVAKLEKLTTLEGEELFDIEEELLGYSLSDNSATILEDYADEIADSCSHYAALEKTGLYSVAGVISNIRMSKTKKGDPFAWVTLENERGEVLEATVWSQELTRLGFAWRRRQAIIAKVKVTDRGKNILGAKVLYAKEQMV
jgi:DNA polymerase III alpha subunit